MTRTKETRLRKAWNRYRRTNNGYTASSWTQLNTRADRQLLGCSGHISLRYFLRAYYGIGAAS